MNIKIKRETKKYIQLINQRERERLKGNLNYFLTVNKINFLIFEEEEELIITLK